MVQATSFELETEPQGKAVLDASPEVASGSHRAFVIVKQAGAHSAEHLELAVV